MASNQERPRSSSDGNSHSKDPLHALMRSGVNPRDILEHLSPSMTVADDAPDVALWRLVATLLEPPRREKLPQYNTLSDAIDLIKRSTKILVLSGAGISTSAGLPDFRSRDGIYKQIHNEHPDLDDPKQMFDIDFFRTNPLPFYQFAKALYPGQFKPTVGHQFIKCIEDHNKLLRNYTQNIDTLEMQAGIKKVVECHGSFAKATCTNCGHQATSDDIRDLILAQRVPRCPSCNNGEKVPQDGLGVLKPNIVFFGEQLGSEFHEHIERDMSNVDLLIVIGSSMKVRPVALIPRHIPPNVPQILINREPLDHMNFDIELLGNCDRIIQEICHHLGGDWTNLCPSDQGPLRELLGSSELSIHEPNTQTGSEEQEESANDEAVDEAKAVNKPGNGEAQDVKSENDHAGNSAEAPSPGAQDNDDNWEDVDIIDDSESSCSSSLSHGSQAASTICKIIVPAGSFAFLKPNRYLFEGAQMTRNHYVETLKKHFRQVSLATS